MPSPHQSILVIGSGFGSLAAAIRLQAQGYQVTILEQRDQAGGRAYVYRQDGFTFDGGPTIITAPQMIREVFTVAGKQLEDYLTLVPLDPFYNVRFEDGSCFHYSDRQEELFAQIKEFNPTDVAGFQKFQNVARQVLEAGLPMMEKPFGSLLDMLKVAPAMVKLRAFQSVTDIVNQYLKDDRLRQVFSFHPLLIGGNPFRCTSVYAMIHQLEQRYGIWFAMGGTGALVQALVTLFQELGGELRLNTRVREIAIARNPSQKTQRIAKGLILEDRTELTADIIVSGADVTATYRQLLPANTRRTWTDRRLDRLTYSNSLFVLYFGTDRQYPHMAHHEILMGPRYRELMVDIFEQQILADDFSLYLHRPTATDPSLAPPGCDAWYVLSPVPNLDADIDWITVVPRYRDSILTYLQERHLPNLKQHIVTEHYIDPIHFRDTLSSPKGSAFSLQPTLFQSAWFRPHNRSEELVNLFCVGAGTHPGAGIPGTLSSGKIVANAISHLYGSGDRH